MFDPPTGKVLLCVCLVAPVVTTLSLVVRSVSGLALTLVLALLGLVPQVLIGHSFGGVDPDGARTRCCRTWGWPCGSAASQPLP